MWNHTYLCVVETSLCHSVFSVFLVISVVFGGFGGYGGWRVVTEGERGGGNPFRKMKGGELMLIISRALGVSIGNSGLVVDKKLTVTSIHTPTLKPDGSLQ
eukprot:621492-Amorphochlora_amoeboformis.AAC.1